METYKIVENLESDLSCGIALKWNYTKHYVDLAMFKYVMKQMTKYGHVAPLKPQHCPYLPNPIKYGKDNHSYYLPTPFCPSSVCFVLAMYRQIAKFSSFPRPVSVCIFLSFEKVYFHSNLFQIACSLNFGRVVFWGSFHPAAPPTIILLSRCPPLPPSSRTAAVVCQCSRIPVRDHPPLVLW